MMIIEQPSLEKVLATYVALKTLAGVRPLSFGVWVREHHPGRVQIEWSAHIKGLGRRDAQTPEFLIEQMRQLDRECDREVRTAGRIIDAEFPEVGEETNPETGYPHGWPSCPGCGRPALDGKITCGEVGCKKAHVA